MTVTMSAEALLSVNEPLNDGELALVETFHLAESMVSAENTC
jgi:hypothetical protein